MTRSFSSTLPSDLLAEVHGVWRARLRLDIARITDSGGRERSTLVDREHEGPLLVQRPFHPEPDGTCHIVLVHPPGGLVSGDALQLNVQLRAGTQAVLMTPAATKLYRARETGEPARQELSLTLAEGAQLEWLPQETIAFSGARAVLHNRIELGPRAVYMGWEVLCLGRPAAGERFERGALTQRWELRRGARLSWVERFHTDGGDALQAAPYGLRSAPVVGTFVAAADGLTPELAEATRSALGMQPLTGREESLVSVSVRGEVAVARYLGPSAEQARNYFQLVWSFWRERLLGKAAVLPRIWKT